MKFLILVLMSWGLFTAPPQDSCRKMFGCHKKHDPIKVPCPKCDKKPVPKNDAMCLKCSVKEKLCRHCGKSRGKKKKKKRRVRYPTVAQVRKKIALLRKNKPASVSKGSVSKATLEHAAELPVDGIGYKISSPKRKTHFGTDEMIFGLMELGARMYDLYGKDSPYIVGDISAEKGGRLRPHINHQNGKDIDIGLYLCDAKGRPKGNRMVTFDKEGKSKSGSIRFDVPRNWAFVVAMLENSEFAKSKIRWIFLAKWLKDLLLSHAQSILAKTKSSGERQRLQRLIKEATRLIEQPKSSPHANHFHFSLK